MVKYFSTLQLRSKDWYVAYFSFYIGFYHSEIAQCEQWPSLMNIRNEYFCLQTFPQESSIVLGESAELVFTEENSDSKTCEGKTINWI